MWFNKDRKIVKEYTSPWIDGQRPLSDVVEHERRNDYRPFTNDLRGPILDPISAVPPSFLGSAVASLLPEQKRKLRTREVVWINPLVTETRRGPIKESISITQIPASVGGLTVMRATTTNCSGLALVEYQFPTIENDFEFPDVVVHYSAKNEYGSLVTNHPGQYEYIDAAPGIGVLVTTLLAQTDEVLVLGQEIAEFLKR